MLLQSREGLLDPGGVAERVRAALRHEVEQDLEDREHREARSEDVVGRGDDLEADVAGSDQWSHVVREKDSDGASLARDP